MPTYEYECTQCSGQFEYFHGMSEPAKTVCEKCGGPLRKLLSSGSGLIFKGSGFYITDYKKATGAPESGNADAKKEAGAEGGGSEKKGESAPKDAPSSPSPSSSSSTPSSSTPASGSGTSTPKKAD